MPKVNVYSGLAIPLSVISCKIALSDANKTTDNQRSRGIAASVRRLVEMRLISYSVGEEEL
jgi:hypothetical protein